MTTPPSPPSLCSHHRVRPLLKILDDFDAVHEHPRGFGSSPKLSEQPCRSPRRAVSDPFTFDNDHLGPAARQLHGGAQPSDAAANDDHLRRVCGHVLIVLVSVAAEIRTVVPWPVIVHRMVRMSQDFLRKSFDYLRSVPSDRCGGFFGEFRDRKSVVEGKSVDLGGRRIIKKKTCASKLR